MPGIDEHSAIWAKAATVAGALAGEMCDYSVAEPTLNLALARSRRLGDPRLTAHALNELGMMAKNRGRYSAATALFEESLSLFRALRDPRAGSWSLCNLAIVDYFQGDLERAAALFEEGLTIVRSKGITTDIARLLNNLGVIRWEQGDIQQAIAHLQECLPLHQAMLDKRGLADALDSLGDIAWSLHDDSIAAAHYAESLAMSWELGELTDIGKLLAGIATLAAQHGHGVPATRLLGALASLEATLGAEASPPQRTRREGTIASLRAALDDGTFATAYAEGAALPLPRAVAEAIAVATPLATADPPLRPTTAAITPSATERLGLTPRELDVLTLLAAGRSDQAIADALWISRKTASNHVAAILRKLGVARRRAAAIRAVEDGLV
jgi:DNA-binding CsgD family transcriptional regulator